MICYLDTSALIKIYVAEEGSAIVKEKVNLASLVATSKVAYPEARAAFARAKRERILTDVTYQIVVDNFNAEWSSYYKLELTDRICYLAGTFSEKHSLRGFDSIHLASAKLLENLLQGGREEDGIEKNMGLIAGCWDKTLLEALRAEGLKTFPN